MFSNSNTYPPSECKCVYDCLAPPVYRIVRGCSPKPHITDSLRLRTFPHPSSAFSVAVLAIPPHRVLHSARLRDEKNAGSVHWVNILSHFRPVLSALSTRRLPNAKGMDCHAYYNDVGFIPDVPGRPDPPHTLHCRHGPIGDVFNGEDLLAMPFSPDLQVSCEPRSYQPMIFQCFLALGIGKWTCPARCIS